MQEVVLVIHLILAIAIVGVVLVQRSEGGGLGIGGGGGGGGLMTGRSAANLLTRTTAILAACFMVTSLLLTILSNMRAEAPSLLNQPLQGSSAPNQEQTPSGPRVPLSN